MDFSSDQPAVPVVGQGEAVERLPVGSNLSYQNASLISVPFADTNNPQRHWDILDPALGGAAVLAESLQGGSPLLYQQTYRSWPMASLAKLLTAIVVLEEIGSNQKISVSARAVATEGVSGNLREGEIYSAQDLLKIMLVSSSNDAAAALAEHYGEASFAAAMQKKAGELKMSQTKIEDAAGLGDGNISTASDIAKLLRYLVAEHPEIINWTRSAGILVQPINDTNVNEIRNINPLVAEAGFLGGKTGTSGKAGQNLALIYSFKDRQLLIVILGSSDRYQELGDLLAWLEKAYNWNQ